MNSGVRLVFSWPLKMVKNKSKSPAFFIHCVCVRACSVVSDSLQLSGLQPASLFCPWDFPGKNAGVGCHYLLQGIFPTQESNLSLMHLLHWQADSSPLHHPGALSYIVGRQNQELEPNKNILTVMMIGYVNSDVSSVICYENNHLLYFHTN